MSCFVRGLVPEPQAAPAEPAAFIDLRRVLHPDEKVRTARQDETKIERVERLQEPIHVSRVWIE